MADLHGSTTGLKHDQVRALRRLAERRVRPGQVVSPELAATLCELSGETRRQVGVLLDRRGKVEAVMVGDGEKVDLPDVGRHRAGRSRLRGLRLVHTHLRGEALTRDDLTDLSRLRLDMVVALCVTDDGRPAIAHAAHLLPDNAAGALWEVSPPCPVHDLARMEFDAVVEALEEEFARAARQREVGPGERAVLVQLRTGPADEAEASMNELAELCRTAGVTVADRVVQRRPKPDPRYVVGRGKVQELTFRAMQKDADCLVFDRELTPGQTKALGDLTDFKVVDRTQLILDIFAQHATSQDGKLQVELAQLKYMLPRLAGRYTALSRQGGGLAARGPGEKQLEMDRRRMRDRITRLQKELLGLGRQREQRRSRRRSSGVPVVAIVGYTNAGKSTLLNALTHSDVRAEDLLFATLDPTTRRLRFPMDRELVLADTVGFIRDLPQELLQAFRATLEELGDADLLLHVVDGADADVDRRTDAVVGILRELDLDGTPRLVVVNKCDLLPAGEAERLAQRLGGLAISARDRNTALPLLARVEAELWREGIPVRSAAERSIPGGASPDPDLPGAFQPPDAP